MYVPKPHCYVIQFKKFLYTICGFVLRDIPLTTQTVNISGALIALYRRTVHPIKIAVIYIR
jgi:hypothetical protein